MSLADYLREVQLRTPPTPEYGSILQEASGTPDSNDASPFVLFYVDSDTDDVWFDPTRTGTGWELALAGAQLETDEARLKVTT
jgi:hypothetical protein